MKKLIPWKRKIKIKQLDEGMDTSMCFAVVGSSKKFGKRLHAFKVYRFLQESGSRVYAVAADLEKIGNDRVYQRLTELPEPVEIVVPCLPAAFSLSIVAEAREAGISKVWFQNRTLSKEAFEYCQENGIEIVEGCALKHQDFSRVTKVINPCYWHGKTIFRKKKRL